MSISWYIRRFILLAYIVFVSNTMYAIAQKNLVNNYSFENYTICPNYSTGTPPPPWFYAQTFVAIGYYNTCANLNAPRGGVPNNFAFAQSSFQPAKTGGGYIGIDFLNGGLFDLSRQYIETKLIDSLKPNRCYYIEFWVSLVNPSKFACNNHGLLLTKNAVYVDTFNTPYGVLPANPQILNYGNPIITDTLNWVKVSSIYTAIGGEQYVTLGNFKYAAQTNYINVNPTGYHGSGYYIDDVSVIPLDSINLKADAGQDKNITLGDSTFIGSYTNGLTGVRWYNNLGVEITNKAGIPGFFVKPLVSTFYVIEQTVCGQYSRDTVNVNVSAMPLKFTMYDVRCTNPSSSLRGTKQSVENLWTTSNEINVSHFNIQRSVDAVNFETIGSVKAKNMILNNYEFIDSLRGLLPSPLGEGLGVRFRIEAIDFDGKKTYSFTKQITLNDLNLKPLNVYPNPAKDYINITSKEIIKEVRIFDNYGRLVQIASGSNLNNDFRINLKQVAKGLHIVNIITQTGKTYNEKIILQ